MHGGRTGSGEAGPLAGAGWGARLRSCPRPSPAVSFGGTPLGERIPGTPQLPTFALRYGSPRRGEAPGVRYEAHRKPDIRAALGGGPRGEARAPGAGSAARRSRFCFGVLQRRGGGVG